MLAMLHGDGAWAGAERAGLVGAGAVDVLTVRLLIVDVAVEHGDDIGHPAIGTCRRLVVVGALDLSEGLGDTGLDFVVSIVYRGIPCDPVTRASAEENRDLNVQFALEGVHRGIGVRGVERHCSCNIPLRGRFLISRHVLC